LYYLFAARVRVIDKFSEYYYMRMRAFLPFLFNFLLRVLTLVQIHALGAAVVVRSQRKSSYFQRQQQWRAREGESA
jgi:hypothetical protein